MISRWVPALLLSHAVVCGVGVATGQPAPAPVAVVYERLAGDTACGDADWFRAFASSRMGHDPFAEGSPELAAFRAMGVVVVRVTYLDEGGARRVQVRLEGSDGAGVFARTPDLRTPPADCQLLARAALSVLRTQLQRVEQPPIPPPDAAAPDAAAPAPDAPAPAPTPPDGGVPAGPPEAPTDPVALSLSVAVVASLGHAPYPAPAVRVGAWLGRPTWRVGAEVEGAFSASTGVAWSGSYRADRVVAGLFGCRLWRWFGACAFARAGVMAIESREVAGAGTHAQADVGARALAEWAVSPRLRLGLLVEGAVPLARVEILLPSGEVVFAQRWALAAGISSALQF